MAATLARQWRTVAQIALAVGIWWSGLPAASAHEGPPFPILMDRPLAGYLVSVWADPDIGEAEFFIVVEAPQGGPPSEDPQVSMWVEPVSGRLDRVTCETERQSVRNQVQFLAKPYFDRQDTWTIGIQLTQPGGESQEVTSQVESTPPGYGPWGVAIYLFPFLLLGGLWVFAMLRRRRSGHSSDPR